MRYSVVTWTFAVCQSLTTQAQVLIFKEMSPDITFRGTEEQI